MTYASVQLPKRDAKQPASILLFDLIFLPVLVRAVSALPIL